MIYRLGVDVGGTNTDAVILDENRTPVAKAKHPTTEDVTTGILNVLDRVLENTDIDPKKIKYAMLGTTHCTNAIVERKRLDKVATIRIGAPATLAIAPLTAWPDELRQSVGEEYHIIRGGHEFDGREIASLDEQELLEVVGNIKGKVDSVAITSVFSPVNPEHERRAAEIIKNELPDIPVSLSHEIGSVGLLERENATVLNASVVSVARSTATAFEKAVKERGITDARLFFGQNDGTLMSLEYAVKYPILTIASGPANSIRGAAYLSRLSDALIVDVGGTTTDVGVLSRGFPRESSLAVEIGGVRTNFRMPDLLSVGLGGGSIVRNGKGTMKVGPDSVGYNIEREARIFGGTTLTATDLAVAKGLAKLGDQKLVNDIDGGLIEAGHNEILRIVEDAIDRMKTSSEDVPVVLVGGGSIIVPDKLAGSSQVFKPDHFEVANAIGAAIAQVSGEVERIFSLDEMGREQALDMAKEMAKEEAIRAGAEEDTVEIVEIDDVPLAYLPGNATKIRVKAAGKLAG